MLREIMNVTRFLTDLPRYLMSPEGDEPYHVIRMSTGGMTAPRVAKVLNFAVRCLDEKEFYCEIGSFTGYTMLSAGNENNAQIMGIDNFSFNFGLMEKTPEEIEQFKINIKNRLAQNLAVYGTKMMEHVDADFRSVDFRNKEGAAVGMGVLFIDGDHTYKDVTDSLNWSIPFLSNEAIIILDDVNISGVYEALMDYLKEHKNYELVFHCKPIIDESMGRFRDPIIHNGISILKYRRQDA
jgi:protein O-GlcNAc transferase